LPARVRLPPPPPPPPPPPSLPPAPFPPLRLPAPVRAHAQIHGDSGLDGPSGGRLLPRSGRTPTPGKAVLAIAEAILAEHRRAGAGAGAASAAGVHAQRVRLVCTGALTNAALLFMLYPEV
jgi:inosine-uridine nucleoside N-ribohydrolase